MRSSFYISIAISLLSLGFLLSCNEEDTDTQEVLSGNFYVRYLEKGSVERIEAHLFLVDTSKNKTPFVLSDGIKQGKDKMNSKWISDKLHRYQIEQERSFRNFVEFEFKDLSGTSLKNTIKMSGIKSYTLDEQVSLKDGFELDFSKEQLQSNEKINILFNNEKGETKVISIIGPQDSLLQVDLVQQGLSEGKWTYYFVKRSESIQEGPNILLHNAYEFYSTDKQTIIN